MDIATQKKRLASPVSIAELVNRKREVKKGIIKNEWQAFAYKVHITLGGEKKDLARTIRHFKTYEPKCRMFLERAYQFSVDYQGGIPKMTLFYWKFWRLYKKIDQ